MKEMHPPKRLENILLFAWITSLVATGGSLYFSEVLQLIPCELCWFQRIFMYPLVILIGIAVVRKDYYIYRYILPLSIIGGLVSAYHYLLQKVPFFAANMESCSIVPCTGEYINWLGFITIPFLAFSAFILITISTIFVRTLIKKGVMK